jgi:FkbM family methyltransferase
MVIRAARALGLRRSLRKLYFWFSRPRDGIMAVRLGSFVCRFYARTPEQLRMLRKGQAGLWRLRVIEFLDSRLRPGDVVYDVGGNIGVCSVFAAKKVSVRGEVLTFEPAPQAYEDLQHNTELNQLSNLRAFEVALADFSGCGDLFTGDDLLFSSLATARKGQTKTQTVRVVEGDRFREEKSLPQPNLVMIDVEGCEYGVIRGLRRTLSNPACTAVTCEVHPTLLPSRVEPGNVLELLRSCGFAKIDIHPWSGIPEFFAFASKP